MIYKIKAVAQEQIGLRARGVGVEPSAVGMDAESDAVARGRKSFPSGFGSDEPALAGL